MIKLALYYYNPYFEPFAYLTTLRWCILHMRVVLTLICQSKPLLRLRSTAARGRESLAMTATSSRWKVSCLKEPFNISYFDLNEDGIRYARRHFLETGHIC